jgi:hypothetical protein
VEVTRVLALGEAVKSPPSVAHSIEGKNRCCQVASPTVALVPPPSSAGALEVPSPHVADIRCAVIVESKPDLRVTVSSRAASVTTSPASQVAPRLERSNWITARRRAPVSVRPAKMWSPAPLDREPKISS